MARLQGRMLDGPPPTVSADRNTEADFIARFGSTLGSSCWTDFSQKRLTAEKAARVNQRIADKWPKIREAISAIFLRADMLALVLQAAKAARTPEDLGWPRASYRAAVRHAREIRNRYTFLDLAGDADMLDKMIPEIA
jgi:glycerol-1-phosphate dehydrogenase [NAD(P)+]